MLGSTSSPEFPASGPSAHNIVAVGTQGHRVDKAKQWYCEIDRCKITVLLTLVILKPTGWEPAHGIANLHLINERLVRDAVERVLSTSAVISAVSPSHDAEMTY